MASIETSSDPRKLQISIYDTKVVTPKYEQLINKKIEKVTITLKDSQFQYLVSSVFSRTWLESCSLFFPILI